MSAHAWTPSVPPRHLSMCPCPLCQHGERWWQKDTAAIIFLFNISSLVNAFWWKLICNTQIFKFYGHFHVFIPMLLPQTFFPDLPIFLLLLGDDQLARPVVTAHCPWFYTYAFGPFLFTQGGNDKVHCWRFSYWDNFPCYSFSKPHLNEYGVWQLSVCNLDSWTYL